MPDRQQLIEQLREDAGRVESDLGGLARDYVSRHREAADFLEHDAAVLEAARDFPLALETRATAEQHEHDHRDGLTAAKVGAGARAQAFREAAKDLQAALQHAQEQVGEGNDG
jgi:hypothetical protein